MKYVIIAGIVILIGFIIALQFIPIGIEPLTEVYFENHTSLPNVVFLNQTYNFTFTIHNLEYREMNYTYNITAEYLSRLYHMDEGNFSLNNNESISISEGFYFTNGFNRAKINIYVIKDNNETIDLHFWIQEYAGGIAITLPG